MLKLTVFALIINIFSVDALKCYTCSSIEQDIDKRCITNPASVEGNAITNCNKNYCTIVRVEYTDPKGKVQSINRNCADEPMYINQVHEDGGYRVYYTACRDDLCNGGSGKDISQGGGLIADNSPVAVLYVRGIRENGSASVCHSIMLLTSALCFIMAIKYLQ